MILKEYIIIIVRTIIIIIILDENQPSTTNTGAEFLSGIRSNPQRGYEIYNTRALRCFCSTPNTIISNTAGTS